MNTKKAAKNKWLTQVNVSEEENRIFVKEVSGFGDLDNLFEEWTNAQKEAWEAEHPMSTPEG